MSKGTIITGVDVGTSKVKTVIAQKNSDEEPLEILGIGVSPSFGVRKGVVMDAEEVSKSILESVAQAREKSRQKVAGVCVSLGGSHIFTTVSRGVVAVSRADQKISQEDIDRVLQAAEAISLPSNKEILHTLPLNFTIDGDAKIKNALGMSGVRLEVEALILGAFSPYIKNLTQTILSSDLEIDDLVVSPLASSRACLTPRQKELGVAIVDIGAGTTGLAIFGEGDLLHLAILPLGSAHITNDIAIGLKCDIDTAERIKQEYGISSSQFLAKRDTISLPTGSGASLAFTRKELAEIIEARLSEIFEQVIKELKKISKDILLPAGIVLTGGGSNLPKIVDFAKKELRLPCRMGFPQGFTKPVDDPSLSAVCGLVLWASGSKEGRGNLFMGKDFVSKMKKIFRAFIP